MSCRHRISLGDLLRALDCVGTEDMPTRRAVAALLGFELSEERQLKMEGRIAQGASAVEALDDNRPRQPRPDEDDPGRERPDAPGKASVPPDGVQDNAWIESLPPKRPRMPRWYGEVVPLSNWSSEEEEPPTLDPLFNPDWTRTLLQAALSVTDEHGPVDVARAVKRLGQAEPLKSYPRLPRLRLADGVNVLVDVNETMRPFAQDQYQILSNIRRVMSAQLVSELYFTACPSRGVGGPGEWPLREYAPSRPGAPVVILTDLGASLKDFDIEHASPKEWLGFAESVRRAGCSLVALVPYPLARVHNSLRAAMTVITWDRATTTAAVRRRRRDADKRLLA